MEEEPQTLSQHNGDSNSREESTSAAEAAVSQLLGMTGINEANGAHETPQEQSHGDALSTQSDPVNHSQLQQPPQLQAQQPPSQPQAAASYTGTAPGATAGGNGTTMMSCQNCSTSITPLWRRDEYGSVLCNACGLFLKLHGRPRPISLKTDVIKSRNRVKTMRPDAAGKKKNTTPQSNQVRRQSGNPNVDGINDSPLSRTGTPSIYHNALSSLVMDDPYSTNGGFGANGDGPGSPMNGDQPQTHEQLIANNSSLMTRVRELELINELFRGRLTQLEQQEAAARRGHEVAGAEQAQLRSQLEDSHRRENSLKRRLDELEAELAQLKEANQDESDRPAKKIRLESPEMEKEKEESAPAVEEQANIDQESEPEPAQVDTAVAAES